MNLKMNLKCVPNLKFVTQHYEKGVHDQETEKPW